MSPVAGAQYKFLFHRGSSSLINQSQKWPYTKASLKEARQRGLTCLKYSILGETTCFAQAPITIILEKNGRIPATSRNQVGKGES